MISFKTTVKTIFKKMDEYDKYHKDTLFVS